MIYQKLSFVHLTHLKCDICSKNNIYTVIYREMGTFLSFLTPGFALLRPQNKVNLGDLPKVVIFASYQPLIWAVP